MGCWIYVKQAQFRSFCTPTMVDGVSPMFFSLARSFDVGCLFPFFVCMCVCRCCGMKMGQGNEEELQTAIKDIRKNMRSSCIFVPRSG